MAKAPMRPFLYAQVKLFVEKKIEEVGSFTRADVMEHFGVSVATASKYIKEYMEKEAFMIAYNLSMKRYTKAYMASDWSVPMGGPMVPMEHALPLCRWMMDQHVKHMTALGRDPTKYQSRYSTAVDAINKCINEG